MENDSDEYLTAYGVTLGKFGKHGTYVPAKPVDFDTATALQQDKLAVGMLRFSVTDRGPIVSLSCPFCEGPIEALICNDEVQMFTNTVTSGHSDMSFSHVGKTIELEIIERTCDCPEITVREHGRAVYE